MTTIERYREDGEPVRRFFLIAEVTFRDRPAEDDPGSNYYDDSELAGVAGHWMGGALEDRDDSPSVRFHALPTILHADAQAVARGEYPRSEDG